MSARYIQKAGLWIKEEHLPAVIGCDASGEIYALGEGVKGWSIGDKVYNSCGNDALTDSH